MKKLKRRFDVVSRMLKDNFDFSMKNSSFKKRRRTLHYKFDFKSKKNSKKRGESQKNILRTIDE